MNSYYSVSDYETSSSRSNSARNSRSPSPSFHQKTKHYSRTPTPTYKRMGNYFFYRIFPLDIVDYLLIIFSIYCLIGFVLYSNQKLIDSISASEKYPNYFSNLKSIYVLLEFVIFTIFFLKKFIWYHGHPLYKEIFTF